MPQVISSLAPLAVEVFFAKNHLFM